jgi:hypothetical protein
MLLEAVVRHAEENFCARMCATTDECSMPRGKRVFGASTPNTVGPSLPGTSYFAVCLTSSEKPPRRYMSTRAAMVCREFAVRRMVVLGDPSGPVLASVVGWALSDCIDTELALSHLDYVSPIEFETNAPS